MCILLWDCLGSWEFQTWWLLCPDPSLQSKILIPTSYPVIYHPSFSSFYHSFLLMSVNWISLFFLRYVKIISSGYLRNCYSHSQISLKRLHMCELLPYVLVGSLFLSIMVTYLLIANVVLELHPQANSKLIFKCCAHSSMRISVLTIRQFTI